MIGNISFDTSHFSNALHQMPNPLLAVARKEVDDRNLDHRIATRLLAHGGTCHAHQDLCREGGIVDAHVELEELVLRLAGHALAGEVHDGAEVSGLTY